MTLPPPSIAIDPRTATFFPGIVTPRLAATCEFYREHFEFRPIRAEVDTMLLARADGARLGLLRAGNPGHPAALQTATRGSGVWLNLEVDDPDALFTRIEAAGVEVVAPPEFTPSATRRFIVRDPNGVLVYVSERAAVSAPAALIHEPTASLR